MQLKFDWQGEDNCSVLKAQLEEVLKELDGKNDLLGNLEKAKNDAEWNLGEHKQWLADASARADQLDALCHEKENAIKDLENRLHEAEKSATEGANAQNVFE
ncbi:unnamed protein product [Gongylonema pulchrum]|uniref:Myosin_tail_1 domain-containing protein n=1 Tax=Gongylonema pulchrum TaxID=637853 RepID=A0A183CXE8_9BILA|nr:unnamed protein product [Gongylonema pulchrum]